MNTKALLASLALFCVLANGLAQTKPAGPPPLAADQDKDDVVKINTNLVQIDAVVTKDGKHVRDLKAEDFEIFEDGKRQTITSFAYISNVPTTTASPAAKADAADRDKSVPVRPLKRDEARRTVAIVVDDMGLSAESISDVRRHLRKFINEQMQPYDLVAIIRTGTDIGALQQFTNDKRVLTRAVDQIRWNARNRAGINVLPPNYSYSGIPTFDYYGESFHSSMSSLGFIIEAMAHLPGRKSMVVLSDSMPVQDQNYPFWLPPGEQVDPARRRAALRRVAEMAIRRSVVIYSIDTQGLQTTGITAADSFSGNIRMVGSQMNELMARRSRLLFDRRAGGDLIARQTGGFQIKNSNDYKLDRVLEDQSGYYLIGYRPSAETFNRRFHKISAKVKRSGMTLRTRYGFFGYPEEDDIRRPESKIRLALMSPFGAQDVELDFTSFFANDKAAGSFVRSFVFVNAKELTFETINDKHEAKIELRGIMFGDNGAPAEQFINSGVVSLAEKEYQRALSEGIRIRFDMPARRPGAYQVRAALRDVASSRIGAAGQFVQVPNLMNKQLAVSGILLQGAAEPRQTGAIETTVAGAGARRFTPNSDFYASSVIYNASLDSATQRPNLIIEAHLFRDGKRVFTYPALPVDTANQADFTRLLVHLQFRLGADLEPGHYYLQLAITDNALKNNDKRQPIIQWADFEIFK